MSGIFLSMRTEEQAVTGCRRLGTTPDVPEAGLGGVRGNHLHDKLACRVRHLGDKCSNDLGLVSLEGLLRHRSPSEGHFGGGQRSKLSCHGAILSCETTVGNGKAKKAQQLLLVLRHSPVGNSRTLCWEGNRGGVEFTLLRLYILYNPAGAGV